MKKQFVLWALLLFCTIPTFAYDFEVDGIYYNILDGDSVEVTRDYSNEYSGSVTIPATVSYNSTTYHVTTIGDDAFQFCFDLIEITIPNSVTSIGSWAFYGCSSLTAITIPNSVTSIGEFAFSDCSNLTSIIIPNNITSIGSSTFSDCSGLTAITIPNSVTTIGDRAFSGCSSFTSITIPEGVISIGDEAFSDCSSLTSITIPNNITSIGDEVFSGCSKIETIIVEAGNPTYHSADNCLIETATKTLIAGCKNSIIPTDNSVTSIDDGAFYNCSDLTKITIPNSVTSIRDRAFSGCSSLTAITIPEGVTSIGDEAFYSCSNLAAITIPNSVTTIGDGAFDNCPNIQYTINENIKYLGNSENPYQVLMKVTTRTITSCTIHEQTKIIAYSSFSACRSLTAITIPEGVTSIGDEAFYNCSSLTSITIPKSVTSIGDRAFYECSSLKTVNIQAINPPTGNGYLSTICKIYVPCSAVEAYQQHDYWMMYHDLQGYFDFTISVMSENATQGTAVVIQEPSCDNNTTAIIQATPNKGYRFVAWSDGNTDNPRTLTVVDNAIYTATFEAIRVASISLSQTTATISKGKTLQVEASVLPENALDKSVVWSSDNETVAIVQDGLIHAHEKGIATIQATTVDGNKIATCLVTVISSVTGITLDKSEITLVPKMAVQLTATVLPEDANNKNLTWSSDNATIAIVSNGMVIAVNAGQTTIKATTEDGAFTASCIVNVEIPISSIAIQPSSLMLMLGNAEQLTVVIQPEDATNKNYAWHSDNTTVATIFDNGWVVAKGLGTANIIATSESGNKTATCQVTVIETLPSRVEYQDAAQNDKFVKILENGTIYILRNGEKYTIDGRKVM